MEYKEQVEQIAEAFRKVLSEGLEGQSENQRVILIKRIPIICNDILEIKSDMKWVKWLVMGIGGAIGILALTYLMK